MIVTILLLFIDVVFNYDVVNCESRVLSNYCYWLIVSDFINVLFYKIIVDIFMQNFELIKKWMKFIEYLIGELRVDYLFYLN